MILPVTVRPVGASNLWGSAWPALLRSGKIDIFSAEETQAGLQANLAYVHASYGIPVQSTTFFLPRVYEDETSSVLLNLPTQNKPLYSSPMEKPLR